MPHRIDIDGISQNLFILKHMAAGSPAVCKELTINRDHEDITPFGWNYYLGWMKSIVSQTLIETAIKVRVMQDFLKSDSKGAEILSIEKQINEAHVVGHFVTSLSALPIREACNKIIHANEMSLVWIDAKRKGVQYEFWNGTVNLDGRRGKVPWSCQLYTQAFCTAIEHFLSKIEDTVDWHRIYKFDE